MMGRQVAEGSLFYGFGLGDHLPADHLLALRLVVRLQLRARSAGDLQLSEVVKSAVADSGVAPPCILPRSVRTLALD